MEGLFYSTLFVLIASLGLWPRPQTLDEALGEARLASVQGRYQQAAQAFLRVLHDAPERVTLWEEAGVAAYRAEDYALAVQAFEQASRFYQLQPTSFGYWAEAYLKLNQAQSAQQTWLALLRHPGLSLAECESIVARLRQLDLDAGRKAAAIWVERDPQNPKALLTAAVLYAVRRPSEALMYLNRAQSLDRNEDETVSVLYQPLEALASEPDLVGLVRVGQALGTLGAWDVAEEAFQQVVLLLPDYAEGWVLLGEARQQQGRDGYPELERAYTLAPNAPSVRAALGLYWRRAGEPQKALSHYNALVALFPNDARWRVELAATYAEAGNLILAVEHYQKALEIEPKNAFYWRLFAQFAVAYGLDLEGYALPAAQQALTLEPENPESLDLMGWIAFLLGRSEEAEHFLQQALDKDSTYSPALLHQAQVWLEQKRWREAHEALVQVATQQRYPQAAAQANRLLERFFPSSQD